MPTPPPPSRFAAAVLEFVDAVPPGRVVTYGDVAAHLGRPPVAARAVGRAMATGGGSVAWWRVVDSRGTPAAQYAAEARGHWDEEGTPCLPDGRADLRRARWSPD